MIAAVISTVIIAGPSGSTARAAPAQNPGRLCPGLQTSGSFFVTADTANYLLYLPAGASYTLSGSVDVLVNSGGAAGWSTNFFIDPVLIGNFGGYTGGPYFNIPFSSPAWTNRGASGDVLLTVHQQWGTRIDWRFTATVTGGGGAGACTPLAPGEALPGNCAEKHATDTQGTAGDPVDTATGNYHEGFTDLTVPGRGPALHLDHSYNSTMAATDGPLGFGWTSSYGATLAIAPGTGVATVRQEQGAMVSLYPDGSGGFEAPARAVATLVHNADGSYTFRRCNRTTMVFSPTGQLSSITDRNGYVTTLRYVGGQLSAVVDPAGRQLQVTWTGSHITSVSDTSSPARTVGFAYNDGQGDLTDYTDVGGSSWHFAYDTSHRLTSVRRPRQAGAQTPQVITNVYDATGRVTSQTDELNRQTLFDYTSIPNATKVTDPAGNVTVDTYQNLVRTAVTRGYGTSAAATWTFVTDPYTLGVTQVTDPNGHMSRATYDRDGNVLSQTDPLAHTVWATYNALDEPLTTTDANGVVTTRAYDNAGNLTAISTPLLDSNGNVTATRQTTYTYDPAHAGDVTTVTDALGKTWAQTYDGVGDLISSADPLGDTTRYGYDTTRGWLTSQVLPRGAAAGVTTSCVPPALDCTVYTRDAWGHVSTVTDGDGHQTTSHHDADGNLDYTIDANGNRTTYVYDAVDQRVAVQRADVPGTTLRTDYWLDGSIKDTVDGAGHITSYAYDAQRRMSSTTDPDNRTTVYGYDPAGNAVSKAAPGGSCPTVGCTTMGYDAANRLVSITYSDGQTPTVGSIGYDADGRRTSMVDGTGMSQWSWDTLGRLVQSRDGAGHTVSYTFSNLRDPATGISYAPGNTLNRAFDAAGRMTSETDWLSNVTAFNPDADSRTAAMTPPAATGSGDSFGYDNAGAMSTVTNTASGAVRSSLTYSRDTASQITSVTSAGAPPDTHSYTYTPLNQLKSVDAGTYSHDAADNLTQLPSGQGLAYDAAGQACWMGGTTGSCTAAPANATAYGYDTRGNRTGVTPSGRPGTALSYDQADRLITSAPAVTQGQYTPLSPARLLDTRAATRTGTCPGATCATVGAGQTLRVQVSGQAGVPASGAAAAVLSVAVVNTTAPSYLTLWPSDAPQPGTATVNFGPNQMMSNLATVKLAADGTMTIYNAAGSTDVIIDVDGWYAGAGGSAGAGFTAVSPTRILDTRSASNVGVCPPGACSTLGTGATLKLQVAGRGGLPSAGLSAVALNLTVVAPTAASFLTAWPSNETRPLAASMTFTSGVVLSELVIVKVAPDGTVSLYNSQGSVDVVGDVSGWYAAGSGAAYQPLNSTRILDTRPGTRTGSCVGTCQSLPTGGTLVVNVAGQGGVPASGTTATAVNVTVVSGSTNGYLTIWPTDAARPVTGALLYGPGQVVGNAAVTKLAADGSISIYASGGPVDVIMDLSGYYLAEPPSVTYTYNGDGLRATKSAAGSANASYTWDTSGGLPRLLSDGAASYIYGPDGAPVEQIDTAGVATWYHHDQLGSTRSLTSASGAVVGTATYDPYGRLASSTGMVSPLGFAGQYTDSETGFIYLRARYYDPATAQFLSRDPMVAQTRSPYGYVNGNPLNARDPSGLDCGWTSPWDCVGDAASAAWNWAQSSFDLPNSRWLTGGLNLLYGTVKIGSGVFLVTIGTAEDLTGIGALLSYREDLWKLPLSSR